MINHCLLFLFQWKYMRETHFYVVCTSVTRGEGRGGEHSPPLIIYGKGEGKEGCLRGRTSYL